MDWGRFRMHSWRVKHQRREFDRWHATLAAMNDNELGAVMVIATSARHLLEKEYGVELLDPSEGRDCKSDLIAGLDGYIKELERSGKPHQAAGAKVWLYTLRCSRTPGLRSRGPLLWRTLQRGIPHAKDAAGTLSRLGVQKLDLAGFDRVPVGWEWNAQEDDPPKSFASATDTWRTR